MRRFLRYLRILSTVFCGIACVLLCVFWVWSYQRWHTIVQVRQLNSLGCTSSWGNIAFFKLDNIFDDEPGSRLVFGSTVTTDLKPFPSTWGFKWDANYFVLPYWFLVATITALSTIPWIHWSNRFGLRTLLIATTLVAVVLALIVWLSR